MTLLVNPDTTPPMVFRGVASGVLFLSFFLLLNGCGDDKDYGYPNQAVFRVSATTGTLTFRVKSLASGSSEHCPGADCGVFTLLGGTQTFVLVNSAPPYRGVFEYISGDGGDIVLVTVQDRQNLQRAQLSAASPNVTIELGGGSTPVTTEIIGTLVRYDMCSPFSDATDTPCAQDPGVSGAVFNGTLGDLGVTHLIEKISVESSSVPTAPAVFFLDDAHDSVSGVLRLQGDQRLRGELYINGKLEDTDVSKKDVVLKADI